MNCANGEVVEVTLSSGGESDVELDYIPLKKHKGNDGSVSSSQIEVCDDDTSEEEYSSEEVEEGYMKSQVEACLQGIGEVKSVLQIIIDQVSQQQTAVEQLITRVTSLEQSHNKQKLVLSHYSSQLHTNGVKQRPKKRRKSGNTEKLNEHIEESSTGDVDDKKVHKSDSKQLDQKSQPNTISDGGQSVCQKKKRKRLHIPKATSKIKVKKASTPGCPTAEGGHLESTESAEPQPSDVIPFPIKENDRALPASEINSSSLLSIDEVLHKYESFVIRGTVAALCRKLAREAIFGDDVLVQCTPKGVTSLPALPTEPFNYLKRVVFKTFPDQWSTPSEFEKVWVKCVTSLEGICSTLRKLAKQKEQSGSPTSTVPTSKPPAVKEITEVTNPLSSVDIPKSELISVDEFLKLHSTAIKEGKFELGYLTRKLATDVMFGKKILLQCTPFGRSNFPGLPVAELNLLKQTVLNCNPTYWDRVDNFERTWTKICTRALSDICWRLRNQVSEENRES